MEISEKLLEDLKRRWENCKKCPLSKLRTNVVFGEGSLNARIFCVSEAPGRLEDIESRPMVGPAGRQFDEVLKIVGIKREDIWITNTCLCRPVSMVEGKENRPPTTKEVKACYPRLEEELGILRPQVLVLAGNTPLYAATGKRGITKYRGWQKIEWKTNDFSIQYIYATLHPASLLYGSAEQRAQKREWLIQDWNNITEVVSGKKSPKRSKNSRKVSAD